MPERAVIGDDSAPYRTKDERLAVIARRLTVDRDCWFATADPERGPHVVPLSFLADGPRLILATGRNRPVIRNLQGDPRVVVVLGGFGDAVRTSGRARAVELDSFGAAILARYVAKAGWEPQGEQSLGIVVELEEVRCSRSSAEDRDRVVWQAGSPTPW
jgi:hypothetical protein